MRVARSGSARRSAISAYSRRSAFSVLRRSARHGPSRCRLGFAIASDAHGVTLSSVGITSRSAASRSGSEAPMTVRRITSRVISDIFGATANSAPTGHVAMFAAAISAITAVWRATASRWNGGQHLAPPLPMHVVVDHQHRTVAEQARQHRVRFTCVIDARASREHLLDLRRVVQIHQRPHGGDAHREHASVPPPARRDEARPVAGHQRGLDRSGQSWSWRQSGAHGVSHSLSIRAVGQETGYR